MSVCELGRRLPGKPKTFDDGKALQTVEAAGQTRIVTSLSCITFPMKRREATTFAVKQVSLSCQATLVRFVLRMATDPGSNSIIEYQSRFGEISITFKRRGKTLNITICTGWHRPARESGGDCRWREAFDPAGIDPDALPASLRR